MKEKFNNLFGGGSAGAYTWFGVKKELLIRLAVAVVLFCAGLFTSGTVLMLLSFLVVGYDVIGRAIFRAAKERTIGEELLVTLCALMAFVINEGYEAAAVMIIWQAGTVLRAYALELTRGTLLDKVVPFPRKVTALRSEEQVTIPAEEIRADEILIVEPGEAFPTDCEITLGGTSIDRSPVLGHSGTAEVHEGDTVPGGAVNISAEVRVRALSTLTGSSFARAMGAVTNENNVICSAERSLNNYSAVFAPFTIGISILVTLVLLIFTDVSTEEAIHRALVVLIVACPTAFFAPVGLAYLAGMYRALKKGVLVKGAAILESLSKAGAAVFDKDDLLSEDDFRVTTVRSDRLDPNVLLKVAAHAAVGSVRSEAAAVVNAYEGVIDNSLIQRFEEFPDGIAAVIDGVIITMGSKAMMDRLKVKVPEEDNGELVTMFLSLNGRFAGSILMSRTVRSDAASSVAAIEATGCDCIMLSDDTEENTKAIASAAGFREYYSDCTPLEHLEKLQEIKERYPVNSVLYIGSETTDTAVLDAADIGVCVNGLFSREALDAGAVVVMDKTPDCLSEAMNAGKTARGTVRLVLIGIIAVKLLMFALSAFGITWQVWFAAMADVVAGVAGILFAGSSKQDK